MKIRQRINDANRRIERAIDNTLSIDGHKWSRDTLVKSAAAFASVSASLPNIEIDTLARKLLRAYFHRQGRSGFDCEDFNANMELDTETLDLAAMFVHAVGHL